MLNNYRFINKFDITLELLRYFIIGNFHNDQQILYKPSNILESMEISLSLKLFLLISSLIFKENKSEFIA